VSSRREFVKTISTASAALGCGVALTSMLQSCATIKFVPKELVDKKIILSKTEFAEHKFVIAINKQLPAPIYVFFSEKENDYIASLMTCAHLGCELKPTGSFLTCPCHGSEFSNQGKVLNGSADVALTSYQVEVKESEIIIIDLTKIRHIEE
jgi:cytochrome b6-f complex iron-sulfur subunit